MPQLNPSPWFLIMLLTWTALMMGAMSKTTSLKYPNPPLIMASQKMKTPTWPWPWH